MCWPLATHSTRRPRSCSARRITRAFSIGTASRRADRRAGDPSDPANDVYYGTLPPRAAAVMREAIAVLEAQGATIVRASIPTEGWIGGPGTEMAILNRNPESPTKNQPVRRPIVFVYELKHDLNLYLRDWAAGTGMRPCRHHRVQRGQCRPRIALWPGLFSRRGGDARRSSGPNMRPRGRWICAPHAPWARRLH